MILHNMPNSPFHHAYRIDDPTMAKAISAPGAADLGPIVGAPENLRSLLVDPATFAHALLLLGDNPQRFTTDLSLYLSTLRTFFERSDAKGGICIPPSANTDARRRLSEDLGVGLASYFMNRVFHVGWETISQIPQNSQLSKKRPDFQGYSDAGLRYLFEAKGTTQLKRIEPSLSYALGQVKNYPEKAAAKIAIISYLSADERFFPSSSFVVDPPALPETVPPDSDTTALLHFEKVLLFAGMSETSRSYTRELAKLLRERQREISQGAGYALPSPLESRRRSNDEGLMRPFSNELANTEEMRFAVGAPVYHVRRLASRDERIMAQCGVAHSVLSSGIEFRKADSIFDVSVKMAESSVTSFFADGTMLHLELL